MVYCSNLSGSFWVGFYSVIIIFFPPRLAVVYKAQPTNKRTKRGTLFRHMKGLHDVTEFFFLVTSVTMLPVFPMAMKNAAVRSEREGELWVDAK